MNRKTILQLAIDRTGKLRASWIARVLLAVLMFIGLPAALLWPQYEDTSRLPATIRLVPQDADWFLVSTALTDLTSLARRHLDHVRAGLGGRNGWPTISGAKNQDDIDEGIASALGADGLDYRAVLCLLSQDQATLSANGLTGMEAAALFQKDDRINLLIPTTDQDKALNYLFAGLAQPAVNITFSFRQDKVAASQSHHVSLRVSGAGYRPCGTYTSAAGTDGGNRLSIEGTILPSKSAESFKIKLVRVIGADSSRSAVASMCEISGDAKLCGCKLSISTAGQNESEIQPCTGSDMLMLPDALPSEADHVQFDRGLPVSAGAFLIEKYDRFIAISPRRDKSLAAESLTRPTITLGGDRAFQSAALSLGTREAKQARIFGGIRPTSGMRLQEQFGLPALPLYLTTPVAIFSEDNEVSASLNINLAPQDMELLKLIALKPANETRKADWSHDAGTGVRLSFNDPSLRSYPKLLNLVLPELAGMVQSKGRIYPVFFDLLDSGVSSVSFLSLKTGDSQASPVAIVTTYPKNNLADALRLIEELSRLESVRRNKLIVSGIRQYLEAICVLGEMECQENIPLFAVRSAKGNTVRLSNNGSVLKLACLPVRIATAKNSFAAAISQGDATPFGSMLLGKAASFKAKPAVGFAKSMDAETSPAEQLWGLYDGDSSMSAFNLQERKWSDFKTLLSASMAEDDAQLKENLSRATDILNASRRYWDYSFTGRTPAPGIELSSTRLDELIRLWRVVIADENISWFMKSYMLERLATEGSDILPAWNASSERLGLLAWLVSIPTLEEIGELCAQARSSGTQSEASDQQLQVASAETSDKEFALIFYELANASLVDGLRKTISKPGPKPEPALAATNAPTQPGPLSKLKAAMDGTSLLSNEDNLRAELEKADMALPYRLVTVDFDGLESGKGLIANISLEQRAGK